MHSIHIEVTEDTRSAKIIDSEGQQLSFPVSKETVKRLCAALLQESNAHPKKNPFAHTTLWAIANAVDGRKPK